MKLGELIKNLNCEKVNVDENLEISSLSLKDKDCINGSAFFCIKGNKNDGIDFIDNAIKKGAVVIITYKKVNNLNVSQIVVKNVRKTLCIMANRFYNSPHKRLKTVAVVGTNGKTTVCDLTAKLLNECGIKCGKIGTLGAEYENIKVDTGFTTPDTPIIYSLLNDMANAGAEVVCMELSAHAIYYKKVDFRFDAIIFTNCTREHLDFFKTFEEYRETKLSAFSHKNCKIAIVNGDDLLGKQIACIRGRGTIMYGIKYPADVFAIDIKHNGEKVNFLINLFDALYEIENSLIGDFNVYNMLAVSTVCALLGVKTKDVAKELSKLSPVKGRMEKVCEKINIYIDYAHTPDGLEKSLITIRNIKEGHKLICVFGCGGNRDTTKRKIMGEISGTLADFTIITSDNPRFEDENKIIKQIEEGVRLKTHEYIAVRDREQAIEYAIQMANIGDYILIAGKGAEEYQEQMGVFKPFSDSEVARRFEKNKYE